MLGWQDPGFLMKSVFFDSYVLSVRHLLSISGFFLSVKDFFSCLSLLGIYPVRAE